MRNRVSRGVAAMVAAIAFGSMTELGRAADAGATIKQGDYSLRIGAQFQVRNVTDIRIDGKNGDETDITHGFELRRTRLDVSGTAFSPDLSYYVQWDASRLSGSVILLDAWVTYRLGGGFFVQAGQFKAPIHHEELVGDKVQLAAEKSMANALLIGGLVDRVQGVMAGWESNDVRISAAVHDGDNSKNTPFTDGGKYYALTARVEWKAFGQWKDYGYFGCHGLGQDLLVLGAGCDLTEGSLPAGGGFTQVLAAVDADWRHKSGWMVYAAALGQWIDTRNSPADDSTNIGLLIQASYELAANWQVYARYDWVHFEVDLSNGQRSVHEILLGVNYFLTPQAGHKAKVTLDVGLLPVGAPSDRGLGALGIVGGTDDPEVFVRAQLNLVI